MDVLREASPGLLERLVRDRGRVVILPVLFVLGVAAGRGMWPFVSLPFRNPHGVVGPLADAGFNPATNILRYLVMLGMPVALLAIGWKAGLVPPGDTAGERHPAPDPHPIRRRSTLVAIVLGAIILALNAWPSHRPTRASFFHEGESMGPAVSYLAGQRPYRDIVFLHGLVQDPLRSVAAFAVLGHSLAAVRTLDSAIRVLAFVLLGVLLWALLPGRPLRAFVLLTLMGLATLVPGVRLATITARDVTTGVYLLLVVWALDSLDEGRRWRLWVTATAASAGAVSAFAYSLDRGYYLSAMVVVAGALVALGRGPRTARATFLVASAIGVALGMGALYLVFRGEPGPFLRFAFVEMPAFKDLLDGKVYPIRQPYGLGAVVLIAGLVFWAATKVLASGASGIWSGLRTTATAHGPELVLVAAAVIFFRSALGRADVTHVRYSVWVAILALLVVGGRNPDRRMGTWPERWSARWRRVGLGGLGLVYVILLLAIPIRGRLHEHFPLGRSDRSYLSPARQEVLAVLGDLLGPGEPLLVLNNEALWYYLLDRPSPTRYSTVWLAGTRAGDELLEDEVRRSGARVAIVSSGRLAEIDGYSLERRTPRTGRYIGAHFTLHRQIDNYRILVRRDE